MRPSAILATLLTLVGVTGRAFAADDSPKVAKPPTVTREQWHSDPKPIPEARKHIPKYITIHHGGTDWKPGRDPADFVRECERLGQGCRVLRAGERLSVPGS